MNIISFFAIWMGRFRSSLSSRLFFIHLFFSLFLFFCFCFIACFSSFIFRLHPCCHTPQNRWIWLPFRSMEVRWFQIKCVHHFQSQLRLNIMNMKCVYAMHTYVSCVYLLFTFILFYMLQKVKLNRTWNKFTDFGPFSSLRLKHLTQLERRTNNMLAHVL